MGGEAKERAPQRIPRSTVAPRPLSAPQRVKIFDRQNSLRLRPVLSTVLRIPTERATNYPRMEPWSQGGLRVAISVRRISDQQGVDHEAVYPFGSKQVAPRLVSHRVGSQQDYINVHFSSLWGTLKGAGCRQLAAVSRVLRKGQAGDKSQQPCHCKTLHCALITVICSVHSITITA